MITVGYKETQSMRGSQGKRRLAVYERHAIPGKPTKTKKKRKRGRGRTKEEFARGAQVAPTNAELTVQRKQLRQKNGRRKLEGGNTRPNGKLRRRESCCRIKGTGEGRHQGKTKKSEITPARGTEISGLTCAVEMLLGRAYWGRPRAVQDPEQPQRRKSHRRTPIGVKACHNN